MKKLLCSILSLALLSTGSAVMAEDAPKLGLAERRALKSYQEGKFVELKSAITAAAGFDLPVEVAWEKICKPGEADRYADDGYWTNIFFVPLANALKTITADEMGKESLKKGLTKVVVTFDEATAPASNYENGLTFAGGALTINFHPYSNADDVKQRAEAIQKTLEKGL